MDGARETARRLAGAALARGEPTAWFEQLYGAAAGDADRVPWADLRPNPHLVAWLDRRGAALKPGGRVLVVGCGLGDDAEALARRGLDVVAFDVAPTAIAWCRRRFPGTSVTYAVADVLDPPPGWRASFDLVFEAYTLQSLPADVRPRAIDGIAGSVAPGGRLLIIARGREPSDGPGRMPWPLTRNELRQVERHGLREVDFEDFVDDEDPPVRRFRAEYLAAWGL